MSGGYWKKHVGGTARIGNRWLLCITVRQHARMPLVILGVGITEPVPTRRATHGRRIGAGRHSRVRRPDTTSLGPRSRLPFLPSTRHTSCRYSTRVGQLVGEVVSPLLGSSSSQSIG